jgi:hypothetical protein
MEIELVGAAGGLGIAKLGWQQLRVGHCIASIG